MGGSLGSSNIHPQQQFLNFSDDPSQKLPFLSDKTAVPDNDVVGKDGAPCKRR